MFENIDKLLFKKGGGDSLDNIESFSSYMVGRYLSFYDREWVEYANETINKYSKVFDDDMEKYEFCDQIIPKLKIKRINYIKKNKKDKKKKEELPNMDFYSKKEYGMLTKMCERLN